MFITKDTPMGILRYVLYILLNEERYEKNSGFNWYGNFADFGL